MFRAGLLMVSGSPACSELNTWPRGKTKIRNLSLGVTQKRRETNANPRAVVLEKTLESPLDCKEIQPVHPKGDQSCFLGRWPSLGFHPS